MSPFTKLIATAAPLPMANIDTDMIIPKQFLKTTERTGLKKGLFYELKTLEDGTLNPDFILNKPSYKDAQILIAGENFGCGSSREHAPWALLDQGIRCVIAPSFADIFLNNCYKNGILPLILDKDIIAGLVKQTGGANHLFEINLQTQTLINPDGREIKFEIDPERKQNLLEGLDEIGQALKFSEQISVFENHRRLATPWLEKQA